MLIEELLESKPNIANLLLGLPMEIRKRCAVRKFPAKSTILDKNQEVKYVYIFCSGKVIVKNEYESGQLYRFAEVDPVDFIGEVEALTGETKAACLVQALTDCIMIQLSTDDFLRWLECDHYLSMMLAKSVAKKLYPTTYHHGDTTFYPAIYKVASYIINDVSRQGFSRKRVFVEKNRQVMGEEMGISIRTVNRCLKELKEAGYISILHGRITLSADQHNRLADYLKDLI